jgi:hypothetical protein
MIGYQNFFSTELSSGITATDTTIPLNVLPDVSQGFLVLEPDSSGNREIIYYTSKSSTAVICPDVATGRGVGGTSARSHNTNSTVKMNIVAEHFSTLQNGTALDSGIITPLLLALGVQAASVAAAETRNNAAFGDLATPGPAVTVTVGANGILVVIITGNIITGSDGHGRIGYELSGANTAAASNAKSLYAKVVSGVIDLQGTYVEVLTGLNAGSTIVTEKYNTSTTTATFSNRKLAAIPL